MRQAERASETDYEGSDTGRTHAFPSSAGPAGGDWRLSPCTSITQATRAPPSTLTHTSRPQTHRPSLDPCFVLWTSTTRPRLHRSNTPPSTSPSLPPCAPPVPDTACAPTTTTGTGACEGEDVREDRRAGGVVAAPASIAFSAPLFSRPSALPNTQLLLHQEAGPPVPQPKAEPRAGPVPEATPGRGHGDGGRVSRGGGGSFLVFFLFSFLFSFAVRAQPPLPARSFLTLSLSLPLQSPATLPSCCSRRSGRGRTPRSARRPWGRPPRRAPPAKLWSPARCGRSGGGVTWPA